MQTAPKPMNIFLQYSYYPFAHYWLTLNSALSPIYLALNPQTCLQTLETNHSLSFQDAMRFCHCSNLQIIKCAMTLTVVFS